MVAGNKLFKITIICWLSIMPSCRELPREPAVTTGTILNIAMNSAEAYGYLIDFGEKPLQHGHCYGKASGVTADSSRTKLGIPDDLGNFLSSLTNLEAGTEYFVKAYVTDGQTTAYGRETTFSTKPALLPELETTDIHSIEAFSAMSGGTITSDGGSPVTERGVCWRKSDAGNPVFEDDHTSDGSGTGNFISAITNLIPASSYRLRAYAKNKSGTGYGDIILFKTNSVSPTVITSGINSLTATTVVYGGEIIHSGGEIVFVRGVCWSTSPNPTIANDTANDGYGSGIFEGEIIGLTPNTTYYLRTFATNLIGTGYGNEITFKTYNGSATDYNGNTYNTIIIGTQIWFRENLKVTHYRNGEAIPNITDGTEWINTITGAYCWYDNNLSNEGIYGAIYNFNAVENSNKLCPAGWHVPLKAEWDILVNSLGQANVAGGFLKDTTFWSSPNSGADNSSGFTALPGGSRGWEDGHFAGIGNDGFWWTSSLDFASVPIVSLMRYNFAGITLYSNIRRDGFSVRCIKD